MTSPKVAARACDHQMFTLVQSYAAYPIELVASDARNSLFTELTDGDGTLLRGPNAVLRWIASQSPRADQLLGKTREEGCKISEILSLCRGMASELLDTQVEALNAWLERRTFVATPHLSLADIVLFASLSKVVAAFPVAQHGHFCNVLRWYENVYYLVDGGAFGFPDVAAVVQKPGLVLSKLVVEKKEGGEKKKEGAEKKGEDGKKKGEDGKKKGEDGKEGNNSKKLPKNEKGKEGNAASNKPPKKADLPKEEPTVDFLDIRVGKILSVGPHPDADSLYVEQIDLGEAEPRTVVSGLRKFVSEEAMANRLVAVVCNLKPAKMRGILSTGMVLCASNDDHTAVDPILIPDGSTVGSRIMVEGYSRDAEEQINPKKKIFEKIAPEMRVGNGTCSWLCGMLNRLVDRCKRARLSSRWSMIRILSMLKMTAMDDFRYNQDLL